MQVRSDFPRPVREILNCWIPLSDGCRLSARIWLPEDAESDPVPAILEYIPYRKHDGTATADALTHPYFAGHGYASIRVDLRGSGDSDGLLFDEYLEQEHRDALEIIDWLCEQPWCSGSVGMMGISWGGFNALQVAALRPPQLKAIITVCSTDDRYADDVHYMGGCLLNDGLSWGSGIFTVIPKPPDPMLVGDSWREMWHQRLRNAPLSLADWMSHQRRDAFWKHGSVCEDYTALDCAVLAVGGWADGYSNTILRLLENLDGPCKGIVGPWTHVYPHFGHPGPPIGFLREALRWWDRWLKGLDTGVEDDPALRFWMQEGLVPEALNPSAEGAWAAMQHWPVAQQAELRYVLGEHCLTSETTPTVELELSSPQWTGIAAGEWCPSDGGGSGPEFQSDQRIDDANSLVFDSAIVEQPLAILGAPRVILKLAIDRPNGLLAVRLCDVAPDGTSSRVTFALVNLAHRDSHEFPVAMTPKVATQIEVPLNGTAYTFLRGHRLRLAVSTAYWPMAWPSAEPVVLTLTAGESELWLPLAEDSKRLHDVAFEAPECSPPLETTAILAPIARRYTEHDIATGTYVYISDEQRGITRLEQLDLSVGTTALERYTITEHEPTSAKTEMLRTATWERGDWRVEIRTALTMTCTVQAFLLTAKLEAFERGEPVFDNSWDIEIPRDFL